MTAYMALHTMIGLQKDYHLVKVGTASMCIEYGYGQIRTGLTS